MLILVLKQGSTHWMAATASVHYGSPLRETADVLLSIEIIRISLFNCGIQQSDNHFIDPVKPSPYYLY